MKQNWRVMGMWLEGAQFLVVLGTSKRDCVARLDRALRGYDHEDLKRVDSLWLEHWEAINEDFEPDWMPTEILSMRRLRLIRAFAAHRRAACA